MNNENFRISSYLASPVFIGICVLGVFLCAFAGFAAASGYFFFLFLLALVAFLWGRHAVRGLSVEIKAPTSHLYPDQTLEMEFVLHNDKALPLVWLEWTQPYPPRGCLAHPAEFDVCDMTNPQAEQVIDPVLRKRFSFVRWYETIEWTSTFCATRRGVYLPDTVQLYTGDGFGLSVRKAICPLRTPPVFVVYPKRVPVTTDAFFHHAWSATTGAQGTIEDVTVLRGTREYQQNDSFKRINWRLAARNDSDSLTVNLYETIAPRTVYFLLDTATFASPAKAAGSIERPNQPIENPKEDAFEETLSVLGSLIEGLFARGMQVGLYMPATAEYEDLSTHPDRADCSDCLMALARADCDSSTAQFSPQRLLQLCASLSGNVYYLCFDAAKSTAAPLLESVGLANFDVIQYAPHQDNAAPTPAFAEQRVYELSDFMR